MTMLVDGTAFCDACGHDLGNASVTVCAAINVLADTHQPVTLHLGLACCTVLADAVTAMVWRQTSPSSPGPVVPYAPPVS